MLLRQGVSITLTRPTSSSIFNAQWSFYETKFEKRIEIDGYGSIWILIESPEYSTFFYLPLFNTPKLN